APDVGFVRKEREIKLVNGFFDGAPDLAVEVIDSDEDEADATEKAGEWIRGGSHIAWLISTKHHCVTVITKDGDARRLFMPDTLTGEPVLPGFTCRVAEIFE